MPRGPRVLAYDALRVFAIMTVVGIHTLMPYRTFLAPSAPIRVVDYLLHYAVPLFVFISGVFIWGRQLEGESQPYRTFLARRVGIVAIPYLAWSAVFMTLLVLRSPSPPSLPRAVGLLLTGHTWYHLYFVPMLLTFYLLTPIAVRLGKTSPELLVLLSYALRILAGPVVALAFKDVFGDLGWSYATHIFSHLPHMALGAWFAVRGSRLPRNTALAASLVVAGSAALLAVNAGLTAGLPFGLSRLAHPSGMAATILGFTLLALASESRLASSGPELATASALAFGVYFVHPLFLLGVDELVARTAGGALWTKPWFPVLVFISVTAASFAAAWLLARSKWGCRLVGLAVPLK